MTRRRFALVLASLSILAACGGAPASAAPTASSSGAPPPRLELRAGQDRLVLDGDVQAVRVVSDPERDGKALAIDLRDDARARLEAFTSRHVGERVAFLVGGREAMAPTVRDPITVPSILLTARDDASLEEMRRALGQGAP